MTDNTSPVATLIAKLPKGNGLTRAADKLYGQNGSMVYGVVALRVEESAIDLNDVEKIKASIQRLELAFGPSAADVKDLLTICSSKATSLDGQGTLFAPDTSHDDEDRAGLIRDLLEWGTEQNPALDVAAITDLWNSWHGGHYDARLEQAPVRYLREFAIVKGAIAETIPLAPTFSTGDDEPADDQGEDEPADDEGGEQ